MKRHRAKHWTEWRYRRGLWHVGLRIRHPGDELKTGVTQTVPLEWVVLAEGDEPLTLTATAATLGIAPGRVKVVPSKIGRKHRGDPLFVEPGQLTFTPRLDWDAEQIGISISYADDEGTRYEVGRWRWWMTRMHEQHRVPRRRDLDITPP